MRLCMACIVSMLAVSALGSQAGCRSGAPASRLLHFLGLSKKPVVIALLVEPGVLNPFAPHEKLRKAMSETISRPVRLDLCLPIQLEPNLTLGFYDFAFVTPGCYAAMKDRERFRIVAASADRAGRLARSALLVVSAGSEITRADELRGKMVAFGPSGDARTHQAGLILLREHGLKKTDLSLSLLPVPGSLKHFATMRDIAQSVSNGSSDAGFIDEAAFDRFPATTAVEGEPARDKFRVIARTMAVPNKLIICSPKVDEKTADSVTDFLHNAETRNPEALLPLLCAAYRAPTDELRAACERLVALESGRPAEPAPDAQH